MTGNALITYKLYFRILMDSAYSDSEVSSMGNGGDVQTNTNLYNKNQQLILSSSMGFSRNFDKRQRKKHELLEEVFFVL